MSGFLGVQIVIFCLIRSWLSRAWHFSTLFVVFFEIYDRSCIFAFDRRQKAKDWKIFSFRPNMKAKAECWIFVKVDSVQEALQFIYENLKSCKSHEKNETKNIRPLVFSFSPIDLAFWCFLFCFFMWFARFQILINEPQSIWSKLLVLSWLYQPLNIPNTYNLGTKTKPYIEVSQLKILQGAGMKFLKDNLEKQAFVTNNFFGQNILTTI